MLFALHVQPPPCIWTLSHLYWIYYWHVFQMPKSGGWRCFILLLALEWGEALDACQAAVPPQYQCYLLIVAELLWRKFNNFQQQSSSFNFRLHMAVLLSIHIVQVITLQMVWRVWNLSLRRCLGTKPYPLYS